MAATARSPGLLADLVVGHAATALVRREDYRTEPEALGAQVRILDLETPPPMISRGFRRLCRGAVLVGGTTPIAGVVTARTN